MQRIGDTWMEEQGGCRRCCGLRGSRNIIALHVASVFELNDVSDCSDLDEYWH